jgi:hypothetical protein
MNLSTVIEFNCLSVNHLALLILLENGRWTLDKKMQSLAAILTGFSGKKL